MKVNIQAVNFNIDAKLSGFIQEKMSKLNKVYDRVISVDVFLKLENTSDKENKIVEVKINVPGDEFMIKKQSKKFEEGVDLALASSGRVLLRRKEKIKAHI